MSKKLQQISEATGLQANYGDGDHTVTVWDDMEGGFELVFCRADSFIAHEREHVNRENLETEMRKYQADLRRWHKVDYDNQ